MTEKRKRKNAKIVRFSDDEFAKAKENAKKSNMKFETYLRWIACNGEIKVFDMKAVNDLAVNFYRIGININQITAMINKTKSFYKNDYEEIESQLSEMEKTLDKYMRIFERDNKNLLE